MKNKVWNSLLSLVLVLSCLFNISLLHASAENEEEVEEIGGFAEGTLVHTILGPATIQSMRANDDLLKSFDVDTMEMAESRVLRTFKPIADSVINIVVDGEFFQTSPEQKFFDSKAKDWIKAKNLIADKHLLLSADGKSYLVESASERLGCVELYDLKVEKTKTYFVGDHKLLVHNYAFILPTFAAYMGGLNVSAATLTVITGAYALGDLILNSYKKTQRRDFNSKVRNPKQDKKLSEAEGSRIDAEQIKKDIYGKKNGSKYDLYKDREGNLYVKPKGGKSPGEPTGLNINKL